DPQHHGEPQAPDGPLREVDRPGPPPPQANQADPGNRQFRERDLRPPGGHRLQRPLRLYLLPPALPVQPIRRRGSRPAPPGQPCQREVLAAGAAAGDRTLPGTRHPKFFRGDAAFAGPKLLRLLELEGFRYAIRIKANAVLERKIAPLLKRPVGRPSRKPKVFYASFRYQAKSWECARRVVAKVEWHAGELFPRV